jgi:hypothetical protein
MTAWWTCGEPEGSGRGGGLGELWLARVEGSIQRIMRWCREVLIIWLWCDVKVLYMLYMPRSVRGGATHRCARGIAPTHGCARGTAHATIASGRSGMHMAPVCACCWPRRLLVDGPRAHAPRPHARRPHARGALNLTRAAVAASQWYAHGGSDTRCCCP